MNLWDYVILAAVALAVFFALRTMRRNRKSGCSGGCAECDRACGAPVRRK